MRKLKKTSRKPVHLIKSNLILISFFFLIQNIIGKIDKNTLQIGFMIDLTFWFKKITKKVFTIG